MTARSRNQGNKRTLKLHPPILEGSSPQARSAPTMHATTSIPLQDKSGQPRIGARELWASMGPAFVASIAYIDPGNFVSNLDGGTRFGYQLLWVLLWSNAMAILIQYLSAKLGIATGRTLPQNCRDHFPRE